MFAATLVRLADGGAVVAVVLLAQSSGKPGWMSGMLGAAIIAPHLLGPFIARRLDTADDGRRIIAISALAHGLLLGAAGLLLPVTWTVVPALLLVLSGVFGPMLTGGVSSRLPSIAGPSQKSQRRAQSWDVASYGVSGTLGPAVVVAFSVAALPIYAVAVAPTLGGTALAGTLVAGYGGGSLAGSALLMVWPLKGDADRLASLLAGVVAVALDVVISVSNPVLTMIAFTVVGVANSLFFAATLAARSEYSPLELRGQVFIWVGALKIAAGSAGTAVAGALAGAAVWLPIAVAAVLSAASSLWCVMERRRAGAG